MPTDTGRLVYGHADEIFSLGREILEVVKGRRGPAELTLGIAAAQAGKAQQKDIVDTAVAAGSFNTLATALKAAGFVDTLKGKGPFTVFAPTDEAFAKLPERRIRLGRVQPTHPPPLCLWETP